MSAYVDQSLAYPLFINPLSTLIGRPSLHSLFVDFDTGFLEAVPQEDMKSALSEISSVIGILPGFFYYYFLRPGDSVYFPVDG